MNIGEIYMGHFDFNLLKRSLYVGILFALFILISKNIGTGSLVLLFPKYAMIGLPIFAAMMSYLISFQKIIRFRRKKSRKNTRFRMVEIPI